MLNVSLCCVGADGGRGRHVICHLRQQGTISSLFLSYGVSHYYTMLFTLCISNLFLKSEFYINLLPFVYIIYWLYLFIIFFIFKIATLYFLTTI